jgi:predicted DCC family thiol-disulfide oxidoreductase YuxK
MITVFYDGACGLCAREIAYYQRIAPKAAFSWIDITKTPQPFTAKGYKLEDGLMALHAEDAEGRMHVGVAAFVIIWQKLPRWRMLAYLTKLPLILMLAEWLYRHFARWRFKRLGYDRCSVAGEK